MGWTGPWVLSELIGGVALLVLFVWIETRGGGADVPPLAVPHPGLRRRRAGQPPRQHGPGRTAVHAHPVAAGDLAAPARLLVRVRPPCGRASTSSRCPIGYLASGPLAGRLSDRYGQKWFSSVGMFVAAATFVALLLPAGQFLLPGVRRCRPRERDLRRPVLGAEHHHHDERRARRSARRRVGHAGHLHELGLRPFDRDLLLPHDRGPGRHAPAAMAHGLVAQGVPAAVAHHVASLPPVGTLFAAFLGYNPMRTLLGPHVLARVGSAHAATYGQDLLPVPHLGPVPPRSRHRLRRLGRPLRRGRRWRAGGRAASTSRRWHAKPATSPSGPSGRLRPQWPRRPDRDPGQKVSAVMTRRSEVGRVTAAAGHGRHRGPSALYRIGEVAERAGRVVPDAALLRGARSAGPRPATRPGGRAATPRSRTWPGCCGSASSRSSSASTWGRSGRSCGAEDQLAGPASASTLRAPTWPGDARSWPRPSRSTSGSGPSSGPSRAGWTR